MKHTETFHPALRAIHWLMAAAIMTMLVYRRGHGRHRLVTAQLARGDP